MARPRKYLEPKKKLALDMPASLYHQFCDLCYMVSKHSIPMTKVGLFKHMVESYWDKYTKPRVREEEKNYDDDFLGDWAES